MHWLRHVINDGPYLSIFLFFSWITYRLWFIWYFSYLIYIYIYELYDIISYSISQFYIKLLFSILFSIIPCFVTHHFDSFESHIPFHYISYLCIYLSHALTAHNLTAPTFFHITFLITQTAHVYCTRRVV